MFLWKHKQIRKVAPIVLRETQKIFLSNLLALSFKRFFKIKSVNVIWLMTSLKVDLTATQLRFVGYWKSGEERSLILSFISLLSPHYSQCAICKLPQCFII